MKQIVLRSFPKGDPVAGDFALREAALPAPGAGEIQLRTLWLALDPLIRFALDETPTTGVARVAIGEVVYGPTVSEVVVSYSPDFAVGDIVEGRTGWREGAVVDPSKLPLRKVDSTVASPSTALGALGMPGQTAHAAMITMGRVAAGETVVISAAAGVVGSTAGQIGKILGARVVGIAGGPEKCAALRELGFDECVDYKAPDFAERLAAACPGGIDVYMENVGGAVMLAVLPLLKYRARMVVIGSIAYYGQGLTAPGPDYMPLFLRLIMSKSLEIRGVGGGAYIGGQPALDDLTRWAGEGRLRFPESIVEGLEAAPKAFASVFRGNTHIGKLLVKVG